VIFTTRMHTYALQILSPDLAENTTSDEQIYDMCAVSHLKLCKWILLNIKLSIPRTIYSLPYCIFFRSTKRNTETPAVYCVVPKTITNQGDKSSFPLSIKYSLRCKHLR